MDIGLVGLGKMGNNMRERMRNGGITVVGFDRNPDVSDVKDLAELVDKLPSPKVVWVMVPAGDATHATIKELTWLSTRFSTPLTPRPPAAVRARHAPTTASSTSS